MQELAYCNKMTTLRSVPPLRGRGVGDEGSATSSRRSRFDLSGILVYQRHRTQACYKGRPPPLSNVNDYESITLHRSIVWQCNRDRNKRMERREKNAMDHSLELDPRCTYYDALFKRPARNIRDTDGG
jgi:hypothetical protein